MDLHLTHGFLKSKIDLAIKPKDLALSLLWYSRIFHTFFDAFQTTFDIYHTRHHLKSY